MNPLEKKLLDKKLPETPTELEAKLPKLERIAIGINPPGTPLIFVMGHLEFSEN